MMFSIPGSSVTNCSVKRRDHAVMGVAGAGLRDVD
jgi:hypothetical protein